MTYFVSIYFIFPISLIFFISTILGFDGAHFHNSQTSTNLQVIYSTYFLIVFKNLIYLFILIT